MSYSFSARGATRADASAQAQVKFDEVVAQQPVHSRDRDAVLGTVDAVLDVLADDKSKDVSLSVSGYVSWTRAPGDEGPETITTCNVSVTAQLAEKPKAE